jgi:hypothetical protein
MPQELAAKIQKEMAVAVTARGLLARRPCYRPFQSPVVSGEVGSERLTSMFLDMAEGLCGAYGHRSSLTRRY